jgi:hypothetical protein
MFGGMRRTLIAVGVAAVATVVAIVLYLKNRELERENAKLRAAKVESAPAADDPWVAASSRERPEPTRDAPVGLGKNIDGADAPSLPDEKKESRMERRQRRQMEMAAFLGRDADESEEDYRARILPLLEAALAQPRADIAQMRAEAEAAAGVTTEQREQLDAAFNEVYDELIQYTDGAVADGQLTPYERNVAGMLDYAGGLGGILTNAEQKIGGILSPQQIQTMAANGFEWAEYLGLSAPWERLRAPPPAPGGGI